MTSKIFSSNDTKKKKTIIPSLEITGNTPVGRINFAKNEINTKGRYDLLMKLKNYSRWK